MRRAIVWSALLWGLLGVALAAPAAGQADGAVLATRVDGVITPVIADHLSDAVAAAEDGGYQALVVEMDTPGGLDTAMRQIVQEFLTADVPVMVHVAPPGARAASAGAVIAFSAHVVAMADGTNIGAATPIDLQGGEVIDKIINDSAAYVEAVAEARGRPVDFAVDTVREGRSASAREALDLGVADLLADTRADLLAEVDGTTVTLADDREVTLATAGARVERFDLSALRSLLQRLADPNLAFVFLSIGTLAIIYEVANPGMGLGGVIGAIMLILAFFALAVLPVNIAGLLLVALAAALFVAEAFAPGVGAFAGGGALSLLVAGLFLFQRPTGVGVSAWVLLPVVLLVGGGAVLVGRIAVTSRRAPQAVGAAGTLVGAVGTVRQGGTRPRIHVEGALWNAVTLDGAPVAHGQQVRVVAQDGLTLTVAPAEAVAEQPQG